MGIVISVAAEKRMAAESFGADAAANIAPTGDLVGLSAQF